MKKLLLSGLLLCPILSAANTNNTLNEILFELDVIQKKILKVENQSQNSRFCFDWKKLKKDLNLIEQGLKDWQQREWVEPYDIKPINGDYLQDKRYDK